MSYNLLAALEIDDLSPDLRLIAEVIGMDAMRKLISDMNGATIYVPSVNRISRCTTRYIRQRWEVRPDGTNNARQIAAETGLSVAHIKRLAYDSRSMRNTRAA